MEIELDQTKFTELSGILSFIDRLVGDDKKNTEKDEIQWYFNENSIELNVMNPEVTMGTIINIKKDLFAKYNVEPNTSLVFKSKFLKKLLNKNNGKLLLFDNNDKIKAQSGNIKLNLSLYELDENKHKANKITTPFNTEFEISTTKLSDMLNTISILDNVQHITLSYENKQLKFHGKDENNQVINVNEEVNTPIIDKSTTSTYMKKYIERSINPQFEKHYIRFNQDGLFSVINISQYIRVETYIAPNIEND